MTKEESLAVRLNNWLSLGLGLDRLAIVIGAGLTIGSAMGNPGAGLASVMLVLALNEQKHVCTRRCEPQSRVDLADICDDYVTI